MTKKTVWLIIGLMTAAVLGIVYLQVNWVRDSIREAEKKFKVDVFDVLDQAVKALDKYEDLRILNVQVERKQTIVELNRPGLVETVFQNVLQTKQIISPEELEEYYNPVCKCDDCQENRARIGRQIAAVSERSVQPDEMSYQMKLRQEQQFKPLAERINVPYLDKLISKELQNKGIDIDYDYGIYSTQLSDFVIRNGNYLIVDDRPNVANLAGYGNLPKTAYKANLFPTDNFSPGWLMIHFPSKAKQIWKSVWSNLLASLLFISIILFCFAFTMQTVLRQKKVSEMKTDFINNMTHEFKTPIATISLATDSITSPRIVGNEDKVKRFANIIKQENKRMLSQVEKVLQMALIDKEEFNLKLTSINLHEVIEQAVGNARLQVEQKGGEVTTNFNATNPNIEGDLTHVSNIINNLLDNANKYSPDHPKIIVHTKNVANGVQVMVQDHGIGMTKEARKHIFDKFYRVHTGNLHDVKGFGLGLSYVKAMMTAHNGQIDVRSELGKGSSFVLYFPFQVRV
ncbi:MAG: HAMP domain-containing sensor histidine kinase [Bacteroidota bacterium]